MTDDAPMTFLGLPPESGDPDAAAAAILPVPYDETSSWLRGSRHGPAAIIDASQYVELYDIETRSEPCRRGIATLPPIEYSGPPEGLADRVDTAVAACLDRGQLPIVLGGEHSVTIGAVRAAARRHPNLSVLQIDAHGDTRASYHGSDHNHACVMARVREWCPIVQVGIRSLDTSEVDELDERRVFFAHEIVSSPDRSWMGAVTDLLTPEVYVTIDLDAFDPSVLPATGTPEPGGMSWYEVTELLREVTASRTVVGFDVVELLPMEAHHASAFTAAKLVYRMLGMMWGGSGPNGYHPST